MSRDAPIDEADLKVSSRFLQRRFWFASLVIFVPLLLATGMSVLSLRENINANHYANAVSRMNISITRLESSLVSAARETDLSAEIVADHRDSLDRAFTELLNIYNAIHVADPDGDAIEKATEDSPLRDAIDDLTQKHGIPPLVANLEYQLENSEIPDQLEALWEAQSWGIVNSGDISLEIEIACLIVTVAPIIGSGDPAQIRMAAEEVHRIIDDRVGVEFESLAAVLSELTEHSAAQPFMLVAMIFVLVVIALMFSFFAVFRPLGNVVMPARPS